MGDGAVGTPVEAVSLVGEELVAVGTVVLISEAVVVIGVESILEDVVPTVVNVGDTLVESTSLALKGPVVVSKV